VTAEEKPMRMVPYALMVIFGVVCFIWGAFLTLAICLTFGNAFPEPW
jgi:hypothetical protein